MTRQARPVLLWVSVAVMAGCSSAEQLAEEQALARRAATHTQLAAELLQRNQVESALAESEKALTVDSSDSEANRIMGLVQARLRDDGKAERYLRKAVSEDSKNAEANNTLGVFLCERGRVDDSMRYFRAALANTRYATPEMGNLNAGQCMLKKGDRKEATRYFRAALEVNPKSGTALYQLARLSYEGGDALRARGFMQRFMEISPDVPAALLLAVKIERALGAKDTEASYALRLRGKFPDSPEAQELHRSDPVSPARRAR